MAFLTLSLVKTDTLETASYYEKFNIALESFKLGRFRLAQNQFKKIVMQDTIFDPTCQIMIANAMYYQKDYNGASKILRQLLPKLKNISYRNHARLMLSDIYLSNGNYNIAYKNYLKIRAALKDSVLINDVDERLILCISNGLNENEVENLLAREKNNINRAIINLTRAYISWLNNDTYNLNNALSAIKYRSLGNIYRRIFENLENLKNNDHRKPVTIAAVLPLSGPEFQKGKSYLSGLNKYFKSTKKEVYFRLLVYDSGGNSINTLSILRDIENDKSIKATIGPILDDEILIIAGLNLSKPILTPNSGPRGLAEISPNLFFLTPSDEIIAQRTAQIMVNYYGFKRIAVLSPADQESKLCTDYFLNECNQLGVSPVAIEWYSERPKDISKQLKSIRKIAWGLVEEEDIDQIMVIDSLDALFDVDVTDFFSFPDNEEVMDKKDSSKVTLETIEAFYIPLRKGELKYIGTQFPIYNFKTIVFGNENWHDINLLKKEEIGPHFQEMKIISRLISDTFSGDNNLDINYFALAIDQASFLQKIVKENYSLKRQNNFNINEFDSFLGENISILFQGVNKNSNGAVQVLNFTDKLYPLGYFDGNSISNVIR